MAKAQLKLVEQPAAPFHLPAQESAFLERMIDGYKTRRLGANRHKQLSVERDLTVLREFLQFSGKPPWQWQEGDFENWCLQIGQVRRLAISSQRKYQGAVRNFLAYAVNNAGFRNQVAIEFGGRLQQICHSGNMIPHKLNRELTKHRPAFSRREIDQLLSALNEAIEEAARFSSKSLRPLMRDKALFATTYCLGLRSAEVRALNVEDFYPSPDLPELGNFGFARVIGKGSAGTGPKLRNVPVLFPALPKILVWYIESVRPFLLRKADPNEKALFLTERGTRLSGSILDFRFQQALDLARLDGRGFTPHSLRHSQISHVQEGNLMSLSLEATRRMAGHEFASTTQDYTHVADRAVQAEVSRYVRQQIGPGSPAPTPSEEVS